MGVVPLPPPKWMNREELIRYRDHLVEQQSRLPGGGTVVVWLLILGSLLAGGLITLWPFMQ